MTTSALANSPTQIAALSTAYTTSGTLPQVTGVTHTALVTGTGVTMTMPTGGSALTGAYKVVNGNALGGADVTLAGGGATFANWPGAPTQITIPPGWSFDLLPDGTAWRIV